MTRPALLVGLLLALAACDPPTDAATGKEAPDRRPAPAVMLPTTEGPIEVASLAGRPVVLQFGTAADTDAWAALGDALADLEAAGATVLAVTVSGAEAEAARAFGYTGAPLAVVIDADGAVRGQGEPHSGVDLFRLASPVLAEADVAGAVEWAGATTVEQLTAAGGLVIDVTDGRAATVEAALHIAADTLAAIDLPADLGTPLAFVGPDADDAAGRAAGWGYAAVFVLGADGTLSEVVPAVRQEWRPRRSGGARG